MLLTVIERRRWQQGTKLKSTQELYFPAVQDKDGDAMKVISVCVALLLFLGTARAHGELSPTEQAEVIKLLTDIPPPHMVHTAVEAIRHPERAGADEAERSRAMLERAKVAIPKLRRLIKIGSSVFDYPGLLARGFLAAVPRAHANYVLTMPAGLFGDEAVAISSAFAIDFDDHGIIKSIEDLTYK